MMSAQVHNKKKPSDSNSNSNSGKKSKFLITVNVLGSAGPIRFLANETDVVASVIDTALKNFAREGRLPVLGSDVDKFLLYCANEGSDGWVRKVELGSCVKLWRTLDQPSKYKWDLREH